MAHYAPIMPIRVAHKLARLGMTPKYLLLLAHDILENIPLYDQLYQRHGEDVTIIVDNGACEFGASIDLAPLVQAARIVDATYLVLPDEIHDRDATIRRSIEASQWLDEEAERECERKGIPLRREFKYMVVPQGRVLDEYVDCANELADRASANAFGASNKILDISRTRSQFVSAFRSLQLPVHVLGFSDDVDDDMYCVNFPGVVGIDSAMPIWRGQQGHLLPNYPPRRTVDYGRRPDAYFAGDQITTQVVANICIASTWVGDQDVLGRVRD